MESTPFLNLSGLWLSPSILALELTASEKLILAYVCQQASGHNGQCTDNNNDIGSALTMKVKTVSDLINKLATVEPSFLRVTNPKSKQRSIEPFADLLAAYSEKPEVEKEPTEKPDGRYRQVGRSVKMGYRNCLITGVDISHQLLDVQYVDRKTLLRLAEHHPPTFQVLAERFLPEGWNVLANLADSCKRIVKAVHQIAASGQPIEPLVLPKRICLITGVDISHQSLNKPIVIVTTLKTLFEEYREQFDQIAVQFLNADEMTSSRQRQIDLLLNRVERQWEAIRYR